MEYIGKIEIVEEYIRDNNLTVSKIGNALVGTNANIGFVHVLFPLSSDYSNRTMHVCFVVHKNCDYQSIINALSSFTEDVRQSFLPLSDNQKISLCSLVNNSKPNGAFYDGCCDEIDSIKIALNKSGKNYSIQEGNSVICDLGEERAANNAFRIVKTAIGHLLESIQYLLNNNAHK